MIAKKNIKHIGRGIFKKLPVLILRNESGKELIHLPPKSWNTMALKKLIVPRVAIIGGIPIKDTRDPFILPNKAPVVIPSIKIKGVGSPVNAALAVITATIPKIEPADTSIPPVTIIIVIPIAAIPILEICIKILVILEILRKLLDRLPNNIAKIIIIPVTVNSRLLKSSASIVFFIYRKPP